MTTLVTGGFGMLGVAAVRELVGFGEPVVVFARNDHRERLFDLDGEFAVEIGDVTDVHALYRAMLRHGVDRICHMAATLTEAGDHNPRLAFEVNVTATVDLLTAAHVVGVRRFVFVSSKAVYDSPAGRYGPPEYTPVPEDYAKKPANSYGAAKLAAEALVEQYGKSMNMSVALLRFGTTFGPGKSASKYGPRAEISQMVEAAYYRLPAKVMDTGERSDCIYVDDIGHGIALAVLADREGVEAYNIATGVGVSLQDVLDALSAVVTTSTVELFRAEKDPRSDRRHMVLDVTKAEKHLGFRARNRLGDAIGEYVRVLDSKPSAREVLRG
jgi:UDP-glucose 4-epimerase